MKLSSLLLASWSNASFPDSACNGPTFDAFQCSTTCDYKSVGNKGIKRYLYGENSWMYTVFGTEKLSKADAKGSYRNVIFFDEKKCGSSTLIALRETLTNGEVKIETLDLTDRMMSLEYAFTNFDIGDGCPKNKRGLWIQLRRDAEIRDASSKPSTPLADLMNKKKTKDQYYLHLQNISGFGESVNLEKLNTCFKSGTVHRMMEPFDTASDMTKCMSYEICNKEIDWGIPSTTTPDSALTTPVTGPALTTEQPHFTDPTVPSPDSNIQVLNDDDYNFSCSKTTIDDDFYNGFERCTLTAGEFTFYGRMSKKKVVHFTLRYGTAARFQASEVNYDKIQDHRFNSVKCAQKTSNKKVTDPQKMTWEGTEDCLFLTISVKKSTLSKKEKLPVVFHIHGGGFNSNSGTGKKEDAVLQQGVVRVGINYRLGALGFLYLPEIEENQVYQGNWGLLDQQTAMKWFYSFAGIFGGDRNKVTLTGSSAGGESVWRHFTMPSSWPYFQRIAPGGLGLTLGTRGPFKHQAVTNRFFTAAGCEDLNCLRELSLDNLMRNVYFKEENEENEHRDDVSLAMNYIFGPVHRSKLLPDTMFNMVKNRQIRPDTPVMYIYAKDEAWGGAEDFLLGYPGMGRNKLWDKEDEIKDTVDELKSQGHSINNPAPFFDTWLERTFGELGSEMVSVFGCQASNVNGDNLDCQRQTARLIVSTQWVCAVRYAFKSSYGAVNPMSDKFYPIEFAKPNMKDNFDEKNIAKHGAQGGFTTGEKLNDDCTSGENNAEICLGKWTAKAYREFYQNGYIPDDKDYSLRSFQDMNYDDFNYISDEKWGHFGTRKVECDLLDKVHERFNWYNWGISSDGEESINEILWESNN